MVPGVFRRLGLRVLGASGFQGLSREILCQAMLPKTRSASGQAPIALPDPRKPLIEKSYLYYFGGSLL